ncbi:prolyl oligopeptidase family serine peptidase [Chryseobacterium sp. Ch-15]|uniref:Prolyl oligopeptidase family serine peptidase n=1 Tax=Chryseobacterium muglaense TaxID=2893752 RepID=A0A9Q3UXW1_9FLAO|nr:prolyl oligopeptidase family serine peptidase [Chryseobacterium muglaense]MBD3906998.1 prolyl oligopeptidase family serine peptidase [Chryseobacterium muglaense]MCC9036387.1 prolyl oligopeptidase family serine peptidase [Chryseobacterium muglaense]MCM2556713.1 prolyl oligopeptidase family serine peptidase [Chryseobacterium muglaense]
MNKRKTNQNLIILLLIISINLVFAQKKEFRNTEVDTLTFLNNRKLLNSLNTDKFQKKIFVENDIQIPYRFLTPKNNRKNEKFPLVITFHNSTRIGNDNENQLEPFAKIWLRDEIYEKYPCYVIAPQFNTRSTNYEINGEGIQISKPSNEVFSLLKLIKDLEKEYPNIDKNRIYLIGYSMGGSTAQNLMNLNPDTFAAVVSVAAVPDLSNLNKIKEKNIWLIHGKKDDENPYIGSVELSTQLSLNKNLIFTTFTNLHHNNIVIPFLVTDEIPKWLFEKRRK